VQSLKKQLAEVIDENQVVHDELQSYLVSQTLDQSSALIDKTNQNFMGIEKNDASSSLGPPPVVANDK